MPATTTIGSSARCVAPGCLAPNIPVRYGPAEQVPAMPVHACCIDADGELRISDRERAELAAAAGLIAADHPQFWTGRQLRAAARAQR